MDAEALSLESDSFDRVFSSCALYQFSDPGHALSEFHRVVRQNGVVAVSLFGPRDARWEGKNALYARLLGSPDTSPAPLGPRSLAELMTAAGLMEVAIEHERLDVTFEDAEAWLNHAWSHGERRALEQMDPSTYATFRKALPAALEPAREGDGLLHGRPDVVLAKGVKVVPGSAVGCRRSVDAQGGTE